MQTDVPTGQEPTEKSANFGNTVPWVVLLLHIAKYATSRSATPNARLHASSTNCRYLHSATVAPVLHQVAAPVAVVRTWYHLRNSFSIWSYIVLHAGCPQKTHFLNCICEEVKNPRSSVFFSSLLTPPKRPKKLTHGYVPKIWIDPYIRQTPSKNRMGRSSF